MTLACFVQQTTINICFHVVSCCWWLFTFCKCKLFVTWSAWKGTFAVSITSFWGCQLFYHFVQGSLCFIRNISDQWSKLIFSQKGGLFDRREMRNKNWCESISVSAWVKSNWFISQKIIQQCPPVNSLSNKWQSRTSFYLNQHECCTFISRQTLTQPHLQITPEAASQRLTCLFANFKNLQYLQYIQWILSAHHHWLMTQPSSTEPSCCPKYVPSSSLCCRLSSVTRNNSSLARHRFSKVWTSEKQDRHQEIKGVSGQFHWSNETKYIYRRDFLWSQILSIIELCVCVLPVEHFWVIFKPFIKKPPRVKSRPVSRR